MNRVELLLIIYNSTTIDMKAKILDEYKSFMFL